MQKKKRVENDEYRKKETPLQNVGPGIMSEQDTVG